jgi:hypothetical protein
MWEELIVEQVQGLENLLPANQKLFRKFYRNYMRQWEDPSGREPVKVAYRKDKANGPYLRVEMDDGTWLHVKGPNTWY